MKSTNNKNILTLKCLLFCGFLLALLNVTVSLELEKLEQSATGAPIGITEPLVKDTVSITNNGTEQKASKTAENQNEILRQEGPIVVPPEAAANAPATDDAANGSRGLSTGAGKGKASIPGKTSGNERSLSFKAKLSSKKRKKQQDSEEDDEEQEEEVESRPKSKKSKGKAQKPSRKLKKKGKSAMAADADPPKKGKSASAKGKSADPSNSGSSKQGKGVEDPSSSKKGKSAKDAPKGRGTTFVPVQPIRASAGPQQQLVRRVTKNIDGADVKVTTYITDSLDQTELPKSVVQALTNVLSAGREGKSDRGYWNAEGGSSTAWDLKEQVDDLDTVIAEKQTNQQPSMAPQIIPVSDSEVSEWAAKFGADPSSGTSRSRRSPSTQESDAINPANEVSSISSSNNPSSRTGFESSGGGSFQAPPSPGSFGNSFSNTGFDNQPDKANKVNKPVGPGGFEYSTAANKSNPNPPGQFTPQEVDVEVDTYKNASKTSSAKESSSSSIIETTPDKAKTTSGKVETTSDKDKTKTPQFLLIPGTDSEGNLLIVVKFDHSNGFNLDVSPEFVPTYVIQEKLKKVSSLELPYFYTFVTQAKKKDSDPEDTPSGFLLAPELTTIVYKIEGNTPIVTQIIYTAQEVVADSGGALSSSNAAGAGTGTGAGAGSGSGSVTPLSQKQYFLNMFAAANIYPTTVAIVQEGSAYYEYVFGAGVEFSTKNWFEILVLAQNTAVLTGNLLIPTLTISVSNYQLGIAQLVSLGWNALLSHQITSTFPSNGGDPVTNVEANGESRINPNVVVNEMKKKPATPAQPSIVPLGSVTPTYGGPSPPAPAPFPNANLNGPSIWSPCLSSQLTTVVYTVEGDRLVVTQIILQAPEVVDENRLTIPLNLQQPFLKYFTDNNIQPSTVTLVEEGAPAFVNTFGPNIPFSTTDWINNVLVPQKTAAPASRNPVPIAFETIVNNPDGSIQQIITILWNDVIAYTIVLGLPSSSWTPPTAVITETGASPLSSNIPVRQIRLGPSGSTETETVIVNSVNPTFVQTGPDAAAVPQVQVPSSTGTGEGGTAPTEPSPMLITLLYQKTEGDDTEGKDVTQVIYSKRPEGDDGSRNTLIIAGDSQCYKDIFGEGSFNVESWRSAFTSTNCGLKPTTAGTIPTAPSVTETSEQTPDGLLWRIKINLHLSASVDVSANPFTVLTILFPSIGGSPKTVVTEITVDGTPRLAGSNEIIQKEISDTGSVLVTIFTKKFFTYFNGWNWQQISPKFSNTKIITTKVSPFSTGLPVGGFGSIITSLITLAISGAGNLPSTVLGGLGGITGVIPGIGGKLPIGALGGITGKLPGIGGKLPIGTLGGITGVIPGIGGKLPIGNLGGIGGIIPGAVGTVGSIVGGIIPGILGPVGGITAVIPGVGGKLKPGAGGKLPLPVLGGITSITSVLPGVGGKLPLQSLGGVTSVVPGALGGITSVVPGGVGGLTAVLPGGVSKLPSGVIQTASGLLTSVGSVGGGIPILGGLLSSGLGTANSGLGSLTLVTGGGNNNVGLKAGGSGNLIGSGKKIKITVKKTQTNTNLLGSLGLGLRSMGDASGYLPMAEGSKEASAKPTEGTTVTPVHETTVAP